MIELPQYPLVSNNVGIDFTELGPPYGSKPGGTTTQFHNKTYTISGVNIKPTPLVYHKIEVTEYDCATCTYKWINRINGQDGPKPIRCAKCKRWDWEEGYMSTIEKRLRRDLLRIESVETSHPTMYGERGFNIAPSDLCAEYLSKTYSTGA